MITRRTAAFTLLPAALALLAPSILSTPASAQAAPAKKNIFQRHPKATALGAGLAAHHMAKKGAKGRAAAGRKPNLAERHPILSGIAAGAAAHHAVKK